jgi:hypothetical protein
MWVVLFVYVVFGHPRYHNRRGTTIGKGMVWQVRSAFLFGVFAYTVPMAICAAAMLQGHTVFLNNSQDELEPGNVVMVDEGSTVQQDFGADGDTLSDIQIRINNWEQSISDTIHVKITDKATGDIVYEGAEFADNFTRNSGLYSFVDGPVAVETGKVYTLTLASDAPEGAGIGLYCVTVDKDSTQEVVSQPDVQDEEESFSSQLQMKITGIH